MRAVAEGSNNVVASLAGSCVTRLILVYCQLERLVYSRSFQELVQG